jgi:chromate transporter
MTIQEPLTPRSDSRPAGSLREVAGLFAKLGFIAFGGPAAHIAMMRQEIVQRRHWITDAQFLDLLGAANLIPGPSSTEMAIFLGYTRAGWRGLLLAGGLFILPAMLIVLALAWAYTHYGSTPAGIAIFYGIKPVVIAIIVQALWGLGRTAVKGWLMGLIGLAAGAWYLLGGYPLFVLLAGGLSMLLVDNFKRLSGLDVRGKLALVPLTLARTGLLPLAAQVPVSLPLLFLVFLEIGAVTYGSGYVLLAFLRSDFVLRLGWLTDQQLLDAVTIGQVTPGPVFTTATFIGFLVAGVPGALVGTLGIFLPAFVFVFLVFPIVPRLRASRLARGFLDGVNVAALGLMAAVTWQLAQSAIVDPATAAAAIIALLILIRFKPNSAWLIAAGALLGIGHYLLVR